MQAQATILWGFLDTSTKFIYTLSIWIGIILRTLIFAINIFKNRRFIYPSMHIFRVSQIETMYSRDNVFLENRHSLENVYNVFSENTPLKKCPYPIFLIQRPTSKSLAEAKMLEIWDFYTFLVKMHGHRCVLYPVCGSVLLGVFCTLFAVLFC